MENIDFSVFEPTGRDMMDQYPELKQCDFFKDMTNDSIKFCYYMGSKTSSIKSITNPKEKRRQAFLIAYGRNGSEVMKKRLENGEFTQEIQAGIEFFTRVNISARIKMKFDFERMFDVMREMINIDPENLDGNNLKMKDADPDTRNRIFETFSRYNELAPKIISNMEHGFGVSKRMLNIASENAKGKIKFSIDQTD